MGRRFNRGRNDAGSLLAATFVVALGAGSTIFVVLAVAPRDSTWIMAGIIGGALMLMAMIALQRFGKMPSLGLAFWNIRFRNRSSDGAADEYTPRIRKNRSAGAASNKPITANEAKEIQQTSANTWVPAQKTRD